MPKVLLYQFKMGLLKFNPQSLIINNCEHDLYLVYCPLVEVGSSCMSVYTQTQTLSCHVRGVAYCCNTSYFKKYRIAF